MSCSSPFEVAISNSEANIIYYSQTANLLTTVSYAATYTSSVEILSPVCIALPSCSGSWPWSWSCTEVEHCSPLYLPRVKIIPETSWTYGISESSDIGSRGELILGETGPEYGQFYSWSFYNITLTFEFSIDGMSYIVFNETPLPQFELVVSDVNNNISISAEVPIWSGETSTGFHGFTVGIGLDLVFLLCIEPSQTINLLVSPSISVSAPIPYLPSLDITIPFKIPLIPAEQAESSSESELKQFLGSYTAEI
jgi:hypothetical protein